MHIAHYILTENFAGSERYCADLANQQAEDGHTVSVISKPSAALTHYLSPAVAFHPITWMQSVFFSQRFFSQIQADIIHAHLGRAARYLRPVTYPRVATLHVKYKPKDHDHLDGLICLNAAQLRQVQNYTGDKTQIGNWITPSPAASPAEIEQIKRQYGLAPEDFIFGFVGRLNSAKRVDLLIDSFSALPAPAKLLIIGDGEDALALKSRTPSERILFTGHQAALAPFYQLIDALVLPSANEAFPLVLGEAMQYGCQIIATATDGARACLGDAADLVPIGDGSALTQSMQAALTAYRATGHYRVQHDIEHLDRTRQCRKITSFYETVISNHNVARAQ